MGRRDKELISERIVGRNQEKTAHIPECVETLNQLPGAYLSSLLGRMHDH